MVAITPENMVRQMLKTGEVVKDQCIHYRNHSDESIPAKGHSIGKGITYAK